MNFLNKFLYLDLNLNDFLTIIFFIIIIFPLLIYFTNKICFSFGILDIPGERKNHKKPTPLSGGIVLCISIIIVYSFLKYVNYKNIDFFYEIILFSVIFFLFGIFDDLKPPSTKIKIVTIIILILLSIIVSDNLIISVLEFNYIFKRSIFLKSLSVFSPYFVFSCFLML